MKFRSVVSRLKSVFKTNVADYKFKDISPDSYELTLDIRVSGRVWSVMLHKTLEATKSRVSAAPEDVEKLTQEMEKSVYYEVNSRFYDKINTALKDTIKSIDYRLNNEFKITIESYYVERAAFIKTNEGLLMRIEMIGSYEGVKDEDND